MEARKQPVREAAREALEAYFDELGASVAQSIEAQKDFTLPQVFDFEEWLGQLEGAVREVAEEAARQGFLTGADRTGMDASFDPESRAAQETIRELVEKSETITETTEADLREEIREGLEQNERMDQIAGRVRGYVDDAKQGRVPTIAQTTVTGGFESQQLEAFRSAGFEGKRWITQRDADVRTSHETAGTQQRPLEVPFEVGGASLMYPGDPSGPVEEVANCRCTMFPVKDLEETTPEQLG